MKELLLRSGMILMMLVPLSFFGGCNGEDKADKVGVTITSLPSNTSSSQDATFEFECNFGDSCTFECKLDNEAWTPCTSPQTYTNLPAGTHVFQVRASNDSVVFDVDPENAVWEIEVTEPETAITASPSNPSVSQTANFEFTCDLGDNCTFECSLDDEEWNACTSPVVYNDLYGGNHQFQVRALNEGAADQSPAQFAWEIAILGVFHFDETSGAQVLNSAGDLNGSIIGASRTEGKVGKALFFDLPSARVEFRHIGTNGPVPPGFGPGSFSSGQISLDAWINLSTISQNAICNIVGDGTYGDKSFRFQLKDGKLNLILHDNSDWTSVIEGIQTLSINVWHHVAVTYDGAEARVYIDGVEDNHISISFPILDQVNTLYIGAIDSIDSGFENDFPGKIDELRVFNAVISAEDISNYYQETKD